MEYHYSQSCALCNVEKYFPIAGIFALATWHQSLKVAEQKGMNFNAWKWHCSTTATIHITSVHIENYNFYNGCDDCYLDFKSLRWWGQKIKKKKKGERKKLVIGVDFVVWWKNLCLETWGYTFTDSSITTNKKLVIFSLLLIGRDR